MKRFGIIAVVLLLALIAAVVAIQPAAQYWQRYGGPQFRKTAVSRGSITSIVRATGTVEPVLAVQVGSFVSGPIESLHADFNDTVKKGDLLARIDPRIYEAECASDRATLATAKAEVRRVTALLQQAKNEEERGLALQADNKDFISDSEMDQLKFSRMSLDAQLGLADANVEQADAKLKTSLANLSYAEIRSPVDGVVIDRRVEPGQTVAASFTTPILFIVVPDLAGEMHIFAKVDEADIGQVRAAQEANRPVRFTVDAYPGEEFVGKVKQIRGRSSLIETIVTFPVVVSTQNTEKKLLAGMTASLFFETQVRENILQVPNAAISFYPPLTMVRGADRQLLETNRVSSLENPAEESPAVESPTQPAARNQRHVWIDAGGYLKSVQVTVGISDEHFTEILAGDLKEGDQVVTGIGT
jgi:HlyD family secretion protein